jgi:hypothetical protein
MFAILRVLGKLVAGLFKSRCRVEAENFFLRHQLTIASRQAKSRLRLRGLDRALLIWITRFSQICLMRRRWFSRRPSCVGTALAFAPSNGGSHEIGQGGRKSIVACGI